MLLRVGVGNFQSIRDYQEISLVASKLRDGGPTLFESPALTEKILPVAVIYGANASGKTTLLSAFGRLCHFVKNSHVKGGPNTEISRDPFALDSEYKEQPTRLDCDFVIDGVRYHYGYEFTDSKVVSEWLYAFAGNFKSMWFERDANKAEMRFGRSLRGKNVSIRDLTRDNSLFLSAAAQNSHDQLTPIFSFLTEAVRFRIERGDDAFGRRIVAKGKVDARAVAFLRCADTGVVDAKLEEIELSTEAKEFAANLRKVIREGLGGAEVDVDVEAEPRTLKLGHSTVSGEVIYLPYMDESKGTARLLDLVSDAYEIFDSGGVLVVDELDNSLHSLLASEFIRLFASQTHNRSKAQLIATTHDTNLMTHDLFRRDQIWLCEKDKSGATSIYPLTDISVRRTDNLEKGYLQGRFGAIPFLGGDGTLFPQEVASGS